jgi:leucine dehydrogenase
MALEIKELKIPYCERVVHGRDTTTGLDAFICIYSTKLGPALGGIRAWQYALPYAARKDSILLAKAMTYKNSLAGINYGGGKGVINLKGVEKTKDLLKSFGELVQFLDGKFIAGKDVGITIHDLRVIAQTSEYVAHVNPNIHSVDPSPPTALGIVRGMEASINTLRDGMAPGRNLEGVHVVIQGLGAVGYRLASMLKKKKVQLTVTDTNKEVLAKAVAKFGAKAIKQPNKIYDVECDIFAPCALGSIINEDTIERFKCKIICGSANNQLEDKLAGYAMLVKNILYAPDYLVNAGGVTNSAAELSDSYDEFEVASSIDYIYDRLIQVYEISHKENLPTNMVAARLAEERLNKGKVNGK